MLAYPARRAAELLEISRKRLDEAAALQVAIAELLFVTRGRLSRGRAVATEFDPVPPRGRRRAQGTAPNPEGGDDTRR